MITHTPKTLATLLDLLLPRLQPSADVKSVSLRDQKSLVSYDVCIRTVCVCMCVCVCVCVRGCVCNSHKCFLTVDERTCGGAGLSVLSHSAPDR